jgi:flagellar protein FlgJ
MSDMNVKRTGELSSTNRQKIKSYDELPQEKKDELKKLEGVSKDFESIFVYQLMKEMKKTVKKTGLVHGGMAEDVFTDMLDQERAKTMTMGIGDLLFQQLSLGIAPAPRRR